MTMKRPAAAIDDEEEDEKIGELVDKLKAKKSKQIITQLTKLYLDLGPLVINHFHFK